MNPLESQEITYPMGVLPKGGNRCNDYSSSVPPWAHPSQLTRQGYPLGGSLCWSLECEKPKYRPQSVSILQ
jgi:hypothetical protein